MTATLGVLLFASFLTAAPSSPAGAQEAPPTTTQTPAPDACAEQAGRSLTVATKPVAPFVFLDEGQEPRGFSIELWQLIAARLGTRTEYRGSQTVNEVLSSVESGQADSAIAAISITPERQQRFDFSTPMFTSGLGTMVHRDRGSGVGQVLTTFLRLLGWAAGILVLLVFVAGVVVWLIERNKNDDFHHGPKGIADGMWWAVVTMATVGYGDRVTRTHWGRLFSVVWIFLGIALVAQFTAAITARLTVNELTSAPTSLDQLAGDRIVTVQDTAAAKLLEQRGLRPQLVDSIDTMVAEVTERRADAAVYDTPVLEYRASLDERLQVIGDPLSLDYYGIAFRPGDPLRECVDRALTDLIDDGSWQRLHDAWFRPR